MDPYGDHSRKIISPLDKVQVEKAEDCYASHSRNTIRNNRRRKGYGKQF